MLTDGAASSEVTPFFASTGEIVPYQQSGEVVPYQRSGEVVPYQQRGVFVFHRQWSLRGRIWLLLLAVVGLVPAVIIACARFKRHFFPSSTVSGIWKEQLKQLDQDLAGDVIFSDSIDFEDACSVWNGVHTIEAPPRAVIEVKSTQDVQLSVKMLSTLGLPFSIRSGGHSKAGYSNSPDGVILSLTNLNSVQILDERHGGKPDPSIHPPGPHQEQPPPPPKIDELGPHPPPNPKQHPPGPKDPPPRPDPKQHPPGPKDPPPPPKGDEADPQINSPPDPDKPPPPNLGVKPGEDGPPPPEEFTLARIGPASHSKEILHEAIPRNLAAVLGFCPQVAMGGFALGGGWGAVSRKHGLGADNIVSAEIVLADATVVEANATHNSDLYWALRGAGIGNFGVVTAMTYKLHPFVNRMDLGILTVPRKHAATFLTKVAEMEDGIPAGLQMGLEAVGTETIRQYISFPEPSEPSVVMSVSWTCSDRDGPRCFDEGLDYRMHDIGDLVPGTVFTNYTFTWSNNPMMDTIPDPETYFVASFTGFLRKKDATQANLQTIMKCYFDWSARYGSHIFTDMELWGGAIAQVGPDETAFPFRDSVYNVDVLFYIPLDEVRLFERVQKKFSVEFEDKLGPILHGSYVNYQMATLKREEYLERYYGPHTDRLRAIKTKYDPNNLFSYPQSVPPL